MAKFIFPLENILQIKYKLEDEAKGAYGIARRKLNEEEEKLDHLHERQEHYEDELRGEVSKKLVIQNIVWNENAIETIKYKIKVQQVAVAQAKIELEKASVKMNQAMVERKTFEKLKENAFEEFKAEIAATEKKEIDELVSYTFNHKSEEV